MPLQKFRDKQKLIYWVVAIIVIPTFILLGYANVLAVKPGDRVVGKIAGEDCIYSDYSQYRQRLFAVNMGREVFYTMGNYQRVFPEPIATFYSMALTEEARRYGVEVSDEEIGTFIRAQFGYQGTDSKELQARVESAIGTAIRLDSVYEYKKAVGEWLLLKKFLQVLDNTCLIPQSLAMLKHSQEEAEYTVRSLFIPADKFTQEAQKELDAMAEADVVARAESFIAKNQNESNRAAMPFLWSSAKWKFDYITVPLVVPGLERKADDAKLKEYYERNQYKYKDAQGKDKKFDEIKDQVAVDYRRDVRRSTATQTIDQEFSRFLSRLAMNEKIDPKTGVLLEQINSDPRLVSRGLRAGTSGDSEKSAGEITTDPLFKGSTLSFMLMGVEQKLRAAQNAGKDDEVKQILESYNSFRGMLYPGAGKQESPIMGGDALFKVRIVSYTPGEALSLKDKDGKLDKALLDSVKEELVKEIAMEKAQKSARAAMAKLDEKEVDGIKVEEKKESYFALSGSNPALLNAATGQALDPVARQRPAGYAVQMLTARNIPESAPANLKNMLSGLEKGWRGNSEYAPEYTLNPVIKIGHRLMAFLSARVAEGQIQVYDILVQ